MNERREQSPRTLVETTREQVERFEAERQRAAARARLALWVGGTGLAVITVIALLEGCQSGDARSPISTDVPTVESHEAVVASHDVPHTYGPATGAEAEARIAAMSPSRAPLPPELAVAAYDTVVTPGQGIEVAVEATGDVTEMALSDGVSESLPMVRDSSGATWRVDYRVPLRPRAERLPLSVTAKNEHGRWRRVWLFLHVNDGKQAVEGQIDAAENDAPR